LPQKRQKRHLDTIIEQQFLSFTGATEKKNPLVSRKELKNGDKFIYTRPIILSAKLMSSRPPYAL